MAWKNDLLITILFSCCILLSCNNGNNNTVSNNNKDSLTAGTAINGTNNILSYLANAKDYSTFSELLRVTGLNETLNKPGPFTVFALTNKAFEKLPAADVERWKKENDARLLDFLSNHIVAGALDTDDLEKTHKLTTLGGDQFSVSLKNNELVINDKSIPGGSFTCTNGVVYATDHPLIPLK